MARIASLSGFPEWLPVGRIVENTVLDRLRATFELHGFASLETRGVEPLDQLMRKGAIDKEVYVLSRLQETDPEASRHSRQLGLHFDLTVPFARYVTENAGKLAFPFKRYQIQKVWRGERPQDGRFREFTQADIDVVSQGTLPGHYEYELPLIMVEALRSLPLPPVHVLVNNRKIVEGFYRGVGFDDPTIVMRVIDKLDKIGPQAVSSLLESDAHATTAQAEACLALAAINSSDASFADQVYALGIRNSQLDEGLAELVQVIEAAGGLMPGALRADLKVARGLDYYTGSVYESVLEGHDSLGSICSGGRYDSLASVGQMSYPGVGLSIGVSRLISRLLGENLVTASRSVPTAVLVAVSEEATRPVSSAVAAQLRARGIPAEAAPSADKFGKQIKYADKRGIPYVWFPAAGSEPSQVKDIRSGNQMDADPATWAIPEEDRWPSIIVNV